jgi:glycosyltransferase involved in cell wall biosynthesis
MDRTDLCILIPAYREGATIGPVVAEAVKYGTVIVCDDCSPDDTADIAARNGAIVIRNARNGGYDRTLSQLVADALRRGFHAAVTIDADGEHDPTLLAAFRRKLIEESIPLVLGIRPRKQRAAEVVAGFLIKSLYGIDDIFCGMKGYHLRLVTENGGFDHSASVGTELAINSIRRGTAFQQISVYGKQRADAPRFGRRMRANWQLICALYRVLRKNVR